MESEHQKFSERNAVLIQVDPDLCAGFAECVVAAPDVFALNDDNLAIVTNPDGADLDTLLEAAASCPVSAILLYDEEGDQVKPEM